jgi:D-3-phosphoglycerate dehydrogenase
MSAVRKVLIAAPVHQVLIEGLVSKGYECVIREKINQSEAIELVADITGIVTSTRLNIDKKLIDAAPLLKWIGRMGSGMEIIDVEYAKLRGIQCFSSPEGNANAVAEHALGMLLNLNKRILKSHNEVAKGIWKRDENRGNELEGKIIGIIGFGNTGRTFAKKLMGFDMKILAYDKYNLEDIPSYVVGCNSLEPIYKQADIVSFHVPLQEDTIHYMNADFVSKMAKPFILINTSRGHVVDTSVLWQALQNNAISGVCLDVFEEEPIDIMNDNLKTIISNIANLPNAVLTAHIAGYSHEATYKMSMTILNKIVSNT